MSLSLSSKTLDHMMSCLDLKLVKLVGEGKTARVYAVTYKGKPMALRLSLVMLNDHLDWIFKDSQDIMRHEAEARQATHGHMPQVYRSGLIQYDRKEQECRLATLANSGEIPFDKDKGVYKFILSELIAGPTLASMKQINKKQCQALFQVLKDFWRAGFVHGDLTPSNIMWSPQKGWFIIDLSSLKRVKAKPFPSRARLATVIAWLKEHNSSDHFYFTVMVLPLMECLLKAKP